MNYNQLFKKKIELVEHALDLYLPGKESYPSSIHEAMRYSVFVGGKRIRPVLMMLSAELFTKDLYRIVPAACSLELIHTYSLIHDDLPAMDDDTYRRGQLTCHKAFGEAIAILAGDALLTLAFEIISNNNSLKKENQYSLSYCSEVEPEIKLQVIHEMTKAAGVNGMIGGQVVDIESEGKKPKKEVIDYINKKKTGALIEASIRLGVLLGEGQQEDLVNLSRYSSFLGEAFQLVDDLLDVQGDSKKMGKTIGMDTQKGKATLISAQGLEKTKEKRDWLYEQAVAQLLPYGKTANMLRSITDFIFYRDH